MGSDREIFKQELSKMSDKDLLAFSKEELVARLHKEESDKMSALIQRGRLIAEVNKQLQGHLLEIRELKAVNQQLQEENQELRDLCCFLDDDRLEATARSREWQRFGRRAAAVMREDLGGCRKKLTELERLQGGLAKDNLDLKEMCLLLEEECGGVMGMAGVRDLGDGSSSTGSVGSPDQLRLACSPDG